ncbi:chitin deacetylase isoform B [Elysia marginata]|uniref:Chitin deacetylase isoform B n=1 Tax=Elysia marginata TaxID=1093978 RepID=A0AAV4K0S9_9GAST|nr:chitin deacetylase isoform B [Elysia marginata]
MSTQYQVSLGNKHTRLMLWQTFALLMLYFSLTSGTTCVQGDNCRLPGCFCPTFEHPKLPVLDIPQIVYFGFDDAVQPQVSGYFDQLFTSDRKNPNGCPITMTLYVSDQYTQYSKVNEYYKRGMEIASHSVTHTDIDTPEKLRKEAGEEKENIIQEAMVPASDVVGWRSPNLKTAGDAQPDVLGSLNYTYDISLPYSRDAATPWPFTLDYGYPYPCSIQPCPGVDSSHPGFWQVMVKSFINPATGLPCGYVDGCRPQGEEAAIEYLWSNFLNTYEAQRAPFGLNMHAAWFSFPDYLRATEKFIDRLLSLPDVYIVNVKQMLEWMRTPVSLAEVKNFKPWGCSDNTFLPPTSSQTSRPSSSIFQQLKIPQGVNDPTRIGNRQNENQLAVPSGGHSSNSGRANGPVTSMRPQIFTLKPLIHQRPETTRATAALYEARRPSTEYGSRHSDTGRCIQGFNCHLPSCFCRSLSPPLNMYPNYVPQIVYLAIDSFVHAQTFPPLMQIFSGFRKNPNGCPISATLFMPSAGNHPLYVSVLKAKGVHIGVKGGSFSPLFSEEQIKRQVHFEVNKARVYNLTRSFGWRGFANLSPKDAVFQALAEKSVSFDTSVMTDSTEQPWPYTLDFGLKDHCSIMASRCPTARYPGLWEVPMTPLRFLNPYQKCFFLDTCPSLAPTEEHVFRLLLNNFHLHYKGNRSPFGINLHSHWLTGANKHAYQRGVVRFFDEVLGKGDVVIVSIEQMLKWMVSPVSFANHFPC